MIYTRLNRVTGQMEWVVTGKDMECEDTDLSDEFSRSQYGDMLHDTERNKKYELGLKGAISQLSSKGVEPRVLDIGSGTGLLSMMAARNGSNNITAIEVLKPMVKILNTAVKENRFQDKIQVVSKHSTSVTVGSDGDMKQRANILVTEVFDSELIGEGAVPTFRHAHKDLLERGALVIPSEGTVYVQLLQSDFLHHSHSLDPNQIPVSVNIPQSWSECKGPASLWDVHLEEVIRGYDVVPLSEPHPVAKFMFSDPNLPVYKEFDPVVITANNSGPCSALAIWWTIQLAPGVNLSMSPWQHDLQWRDHWLPCVQVLPEPILLQEGSKLNIQVINDEYTMWASIINTVPRVIECNKKRPVCTCGTHLAWSRSRLRMMNNAQRNSLFMSAIDKISTFGVSSVLCVSDGSLLPFMCSQNSSSIKKIFAVESNKHSHHSIQQLIQETPLSTPIKLIHKDATSIMADDIDGELIQAVIAEPSFITTTLPWDNLHYWYIISSLASLLAPNPIIMPCTGFLKAIAVKFKDLHLLKASVGFVEGLDITAYDRAVTDSRVKPIGEALDPEDYALWEYPCYPLSDVQTIMTFDLTHPVSDEEFSQQGVFPLYLSSTDGCHGVVVWMEYQLIPDEPSLLFSEGLLQPPVNGHQLVWSNCHNQGVCFFMEYEKQNITYNARFNPNDGDIRLKFI